MGIDSTIERYYTGEMAAAFIAGYVRALAAHNIKVEDTEELFDTAWLAFEIFLIDLATNDDGRRQTERIAEGLDAVAHERLAFIKNYLKDVNDVV